MINIGKIIDDIDKGLGESQQNIINLTEPDYEVYPLFVHMDTQLSLQIDLEIEYITWVGENLIWGHSTQGMWGLNKWGSTSPNWIKKQKWVNI